MTLPVPDCLFPDFPAADRSFHQNGIAEALQRVLERGQFVLGTEVNAFEAEFAAFLGVGHAVGVASGTPLGSRMRPLFRAAAARRPESSTSNASSG